MKHKHLILSFALFAMMFAACDNNVVSRAEYNALLSERNALEAENDSLQFELSNLQIYVECLEEDNAELVEDLRHTPCN